MTTTSALGWIAGVVTLGAGLPQALRLLRTRDSDGVVIETYIAWSMMCVWWMTWGFIVRSWPIAIVNGTCLLAVGTVVVLLRPSLRQRSLLMATLPAIVIVALVSTPALAVVASCWQVVFIAPTLRLVRRGTDVSGVSRLTWVLLATANVGWVAYDTLIGYAPAGVISALTVLLAAVVLWRLRSPRGGSSPSLHGEEHE
jgi:MtN3 and saliva related transmembrane protein